MKSVAHIQQIKSKLIVDIFRQMKTWDSFYKFGRKKCRKASYDIIVFY